VLDGGTPEAGEIVVLFFVPFPIQWEDDFFGRNPNDAPIPPRRNGIPGLFMLQQRLLHRSAHGAVNERPFFKYPSNVLVPAFGFHSDYYMYYTTKLGIQENNL
jgi:hypothetical protein